MARDLACSAVLLAIAAGYYLVASNIGRSALADEVGPAGLPLVYAGMLALLAALIGAEGVAGAFLKRRLARPETVAAGGESPRIRRVAAVAAVGLAYLLGVSIAGYLPALALAIAATAWLLGENLSLRLAAIAAAGAAVFWLLFVVVLGVPMPGPWSF